MSFTANLVPNCIWIVVRCTSTQIELRHTGGTFEKRPWSGPILEAGKVIDLAPFADGALLGDALQAYAKSLAPMPRLEHDLRASDCVRLNKYGRSIARDTSPAEEALIMVVVAMEGSLAVMRHLRGDRPAAWHLSYLERVEHSGCDRGAGGCLACDTLAKHDPTAKVDLRSDAIHPREVDLAKPAPLPRTKCLRCGAPSYHSLFSSTCLRDGGCKTLDERVGEPRIMPPDRSGGCLNWDVFSGLSRGEESWYAAGCGPFEMAAGPFATQALAVEAWKTGRKRLLR